MSTSAEPLAIQSLRAEIQADLARVLPPEKIDEELHKTLRKEVLARLSRALQHFSAHIEYGYALEKAKEATLQATLERVCEETLTFLRKPEYRVLQQLSSGDEEE